jgi:hypothetical protein
MLKAIVVLGGAPPQLAKMSRSTSSSLRGGPAGSMTRCTVRGADEGDRRAPRTAVAAQLWTSPSTPSMLARMTTASLLTVTSTVAPAAWQCSIADQSAR